MGENLYNLIERMAEYCFLFATISVKYSQRVPLIFFQTSFCIFFDGQEKTVPMAVLNRMEKQTGAF